jgi:novobiocin biosynthesis protein NovU/D-mycarose 3-C-methyltransferase
MTDAFVDSFYEDESFVLEDHALDQSRIADLVSAFGREVIEGARLLDIGGGNNPIAGPISGLGYRCESWVVDINPKPLAGELASKVVTGRFENADLPQGYFDLATSFFSMEHFNHPPDIVAKMAEVLRPGGLAVVEVPNLTGLIDFIPHYMVFHQHVSIFSVGSLGSLFSLQGFRRKALLREDASIYLVYENVHGTKELSPVSVDSWAELDRFRSRMEVIGEEIKALELLADGCRLGLYAAGGGSNLFLANFPWLRERLSVVFDRDERKQGRTVPGTDLVILPPEKIASSGIGKLLFLSDAIHDDAAPSLSVDCVNLYRFLKAPIETENEKQKKT